MDGENLQEAISTSERAGIDLNPIIGVTLDEVYEIARLAKPLVRVLRQNGVKSISITIKASGVKVKYEDVCHINA